MTYETLYRIEAPHMVAGLGIGIDGFVNWSAPIVAFMIGWQLPKVTDYCRQKGWRLQEVGGYGQAL